MVRIATSLLIVISIVFSNIAKAQDLPVATGSAISPAEATEALRFHNEARAEVGVGPINWSDTLATFAQAWADQLVATGCKPGHRPQQGEWKQQHGENIFWGKGRAYKALDASKSWHSEKKDYSYGPLTGNDWYATGHYTQMVWRNTQQVGMGKATCPDGTVIVVANYNPPGNVIGQKPY